MNIMKKAAFIENLIIFFLLPAALIIPAVIIMGFYFGSRTDQILKNTETASEYQVNIFAERANRILENTDTMLRLISMLITEEADWDGEISPSAERQIRNEKLLNPEVEYITILRSDGSIIWKSIRAPEDDFPCYLECIETHITKGQKFNISCNDYYLDGRQIIILSRTAIHAEGNTAVITAAVAASSLLPSSMDSYFKQAQYSGLLNSDFEVLDESGRLYEDDEGRHYPSPASMQAKDAVTGGFHLEHGKDWVFTMIQIKSFPLYATVFNKFDDQLMTLRLQIFGISITIVILIMLLCLAWVFNRQRKKKIIAEEQSRRRGLLIREVHHRVKNNLSMITSIIGIIIENGGPFTRSTFESLRVRINAISNIHEQLYKDEDFENINIGEYLENLASDTVSAICPFKINLTADIESAALSNKKAGFLGIIFTEMLTNAVKYGLEPGGSLTIQGRKTDGKYRLSVENSGKPYRPENKGLGSILIDSLTRQIGAETSLDTSGNTTCIITIDLGDQDG